MSPHVVVSNKGDERTSGGCVSAVWYERALDARAEVERLREALEDIVGCPLGAADDGEMRNMARDALNGGTA